VQTQKVIKEEFPEVLVGYQAGDIADEGSVAEIFRRASEVLGPLDVLVFTPYE
jgi:NAD(P)-dependent dehydrogenase (short-subunit alcohol dehydrogenase family)